VPLIEFRALAHTIIKSPNEQADYQNAKYKHKYQAAKAIMLHSLLDFLEKVKGKKSKREKRKG
jgi:hypothetical protein